MEFYPWNGVDCIYRKGYYINMSLYPDWDNLYYACILPNNRKISKNAVVAQNLSECIILEFYSPITGGYNKSEYCSVDFTNISCSEGKIMYIHRAYPRNW